MALEALRVRIVAPIPGKAAVGIEVPNRTRETVYLKEVLADDTFRSAKSKLTMALGKDIAGLPVSVDLAKMPHLLVAGTTGSGKSVSVNTMVCSLLMNASPDEVKMIMIDPKMLELSIYEGIPHLLLPVVTDPKKAALALRWAVEEMDRRYDLISKSGVRDIGGFNKKVEKHLELQSPAEQLSLGVDVDDISRTNPSEPLQKLPYIVVLIDEFADLMMVAGKEVEICVARIAQKARAAGIHLILATQRPSVDVITGLIKANFPSRIAFQVASRVDSRTILDAQGAENLLGMGDMLFTDRGQALRRIHGGLITDNEVHRVVEHLKQLGKPIYDMDILKPRGDDDEEGAEEEVVDELYDQAVRIVSEVAADLDLDAAAQDADWLQPLGPHDRAHGARLHRRCRRWRQGCPRGPGPQPLTALTAPHRGRDPNLPQSTALLGVKTPKLPSPLRPFGVATPTQASPFRQLGVKTPKPRSLLRQFGVKTPKRPNPLRLLGVATPKSRSLLRLLGVKTPNRPVHWACSGSRPTCGPWPALHR
jgi:hypothetical protein